MPHPKITAGALFLMAAIQFTLCLIIAEATYPGYSISANYISDLGVGPSAIIFNVSVFILGLLVLAGTILQRHKPNIKTLNTLLLLMAISAMGVGIFTKNYPLPHGAISSAAFFFAALSSITSHKILPKNLSKISIMLGAMTLTALTFFSAGMLTSGSLTSTTAHDSAFYIGLGPGGMERMIVYPALSWLTAIGAYLTIKQET
ncbi:hypothetical protein AC478_00180 [miscellaneous Crenarchaeota group-1 archaeon SG8-32-3]|uniref:DUF998 domain-containing protein n=1 Tax=miscellaneous Crenarchaeota group-1 archaeon SG8-32-3 TaxID=1685125 RepID=A0A0M0BV49_9ARCH|nr:MAG: hypothetical protein AC478_00180 [miscellaneous Crenarchaeota group-1 archaeon SG8-32-3]